MFGLKSRVKKGAELLDEKYPGWYWDVNIGNLDLGNEHKCILGQLYGDYFNAVSILKLSFYDSTYEYGFSLHIREPWNSWNALTRHWTRAIEQRRHAHNVRANSSAR
jgi:hypothetical protein